MNPPVKKATVKTSASDVAAWRDKPDDGLMSGPRGPRADDGYRGIRLMIWLYFWLLLFEGVLRKWVFPGASNALIIVRDPVVALCYLIALKNGKFPGGAFVGSALILGVVSVMVSLAAGSTGAIQGVLLITAFGFHANFFHIPMIFLIRDAFDRERLRAIGKWALLIAPLTAVLVFLQYKSPGDAWVNRGAGKDSAQIWAGVGGIDKIRPAGLFSYNTGNAAYLSLVAAFLLNAVLVKKELSQKIAVIGAASLAVAGSLSISRTCVFSIVLVFIAAGLCTLMAPKLSTRSVLIAALVGILYLIVSHFSVLGEGITILQQRVEDAGGMKEGGSDRFLDTFIEPFRVMDRAGFLGAGLGRGTNAAGGLLRGERQFMLGTENEWARHILESGLILGGAFILWRIALFFRLLSVSLTALQALNPLPMLLFSACFLLVLNAPIGIPMTLGFVVMGAGMTLAAAKESDTASLDDMLPAEADRPVVRGRSLYAEKLHSGRPV
jgi:hypothetical protein